MKVKWITYAREITILLNRPPSQKLISEIDPSVVQFILLCKEKFMFYIILGWINTREIYLGSFIDIFFFFAFLQFESQNLVLKTWFSE